MILLLLVLFLASFSSAKNLRNEEKSDYCYIEKVPNYHATGIHLCSSHGLFADACDTYAYVCKQQYQQYQQYPIPQQYPLLTIKAYFTKEYSSPSVTYGYFENCITVDKIFRYVVKKFINDDNVQSENDRGPKNTTVCHLKFTGKLVTSKKTVPIKTSVYLPGNNVGCDLLQDSYNDLVKECDRENEDTILYLIGFIVLFVSIICSIGFIIYRNNKILTNTATDTDISTPPTDTIN
jgi:hypothetical protein